MSSPWLPNCQRDRSGVTRPSQIHPTLDLESILIQHAEVYCVSPARIYTKPMPREISFETVSAAHSAVAAPSGLPPEFASHDAYWLAYINSLC
jgi:hypothetical protein